METFFETTETETEGLSLAEAKALLKSETKEMTEKVFSLHARIVKNGQESITLAIECGDELIAIKSLPGHGAWGKWQEENTKPGFSVQTMRRYIRLAECAKEESLGIVIKGCESLTDAFVACGI